MTVDPHRLPSGMRLGSYIVEATLGHGANTAVYLAHDTRNGARVAVKTVRRDAQFDAEGNPRRLKHELEILRRLNHPAICRVFDFAEDKGILYLVMEYVEGHTIQAELRRVQKISAQRLVRIMCQVCDGVAAAHTADILHRDLKPANIVLRPGDVPVLLDFGYAIAPEISRITAHGAWVGTLQYAAPELLKNESATVLSDLYSLGAIMYQCLSGQMPFGGHSYGEVASLKLFQDPKPLSELVRDLPAELIAIVAKAMHREPRERYESVDRLARALAELKLPELEGPTLVVRKRRPTVTRDAGKAAASDKKDLAPATPKANAPEPPGSLDPKERYEWYLMAIRSVRTEKGLALGDVAEADALERAAALDTGRGLRDRSIDSLRDAYAALFATEVDRVFVEQKIQRFDKTMRESGGYQKMDFLSPALDRVMRAFEDKKYVDASKALNEAKMILGVHQEGQAPPKA
jgi:serine/threonine protein kinase